MKIKFYKNSSEKNKIGKSLSSELTLNGNLRDECSITSPSILVEATSLVDYNYCYIPEFKRYYFISDITSVRNGLWRVSLKCDVLESFKSRILASSCIVDKQYNLSNANRYLDDGSYVIQSDTTTEIKKFSNGFNSSGDFILITAGAIS